MTFDENKDAFIAFMTNDLHIHKSILPFDEDEQRFYQSDVDIAFKSYLAGQASAIPDGYVLAPVEPTQEMINAGMDKRAGWCCDADEIFTAMIAAAQKDMK